jgi:hypothetical protein
VGNVAADLYQMNTTNTNTTDLGALGFPAIGAIIGPDGATMYAVEFGQSGNLFALSPPSTNTMFIGSLMLNNGSYGLMAFSPNGILYADEARSNGNDILASVNTATGATTLVVTGMGADIFFRRVPERNVIRLRPPMAISTRSTPTAESRPSTAVIALGPVPGIMLMHRRSLRLRYQGHLPWPL